MPLADLPSLPSQSDVIIDSNILIYCFNRKSQECLAFLKRCAAQDVYGFVPIEVLNEVCHKLMLAEAVSKKIISVEDAGQLKSKPSEVRDLQQYWDYTKQVYQLNLAVVDLDSERFRDGQPIRKAEGLLTVDSLIIAAARRLGIHQLATRDRDFGAVSGLTVYRPTDV